MNSGGFAQRRMRYERAPPSGPTTLWLDYRGRVALIFPHDTCQCANFCAVTKQSQTFLLKHLICLPRGVLSEMAWFRQLCAGTKEVREAIYCVRYPTVVSLTSMV